MKQVNPVRADVGGFSSACLAYALAMFVVSAFYQLIWISINLLGYDGDVGMAFRATQKAAQADGMPYLLAVCVGLLIFWFYRKGSLFRTDIRGKKKKMTVSVFLSMTSFLLLAQLFSALSNQAFEMLLNSMGYTVLQGLEAATADTKSVTMLLYASFVGPISEEIIFRGAGMRLFEKYGKVFAIVMSSVIFGLFHGNFPQFFFASVVGVGFAYLALEYSFVWAVFFHIFNNLVIGSILPALYGYLPENVGNVFHLLLLLTGTGASIALFIIKLPQIKAYIAANRPETGTFSKGLQSVWFWIFLVCMVLMAFLFIRKLS